MRYRGHYIIKHSYNTVPAVRVAGFGQEPVRPLAAVSLLLLFDQYGFEVGVISPPAGLMYPELQLF